jgi:hypothetical protein
VSSRHPNRRRAVVVAVVSLTALAACSDPAPPAAELAGEMIDTLDVSDAVKDCMHEAVDEFALTPEEATGFEDLDDVAAKADGGNQLAQQVMDRFEAELAACRTRS